VILQDLQQFSSGQGEEGEVLEPLTDKVTVYTDVTEQQDECAKNNGKGHEECEGVAVCGEDNKADNEMPTYGTPDCGGKDKHVAA
jgi:hypothetical protein